MMGLLGTSFDDPRTMATLALAQGLLGGGGSMQRLAGGLAGYQGVMGQSKREEEERKRRALQEQMFQLQIQSTLKQQQAAEQAQQRQAKDEGLIRNLATGTPADGMGPPTMRPQMDPQAFLAGGGSMQGLGALAQVNQMLAPQGADYKVVGGSLVKIGPEGVSEAYRAPEKPAAAPSAVQEYQFAQQHGYRGTFQQWVMDKAKAGASNISYGAPITAINPATGKPELVRPDNRGGMSFTGVQPVDAVKPLTEGQAKAATFESQMRAAENELQNTPLDPTKIWNQADVMLASGATNFLASPAAQRARQAQEQWAESFLRFKTGAAATKDEVILNVRTFFPQPGDSAEVIEQKRRMREQAMKDVSVSAGPGASANRAAQPSADNDPLGIRGR